VQYNKALGATRAPQATNDWQPLLKWVAGAAWDGSNRKGPARVSKLAAMMTYWMLHRADDPAYSPLDRATQDGVPVPGTSSFAKWVSSCSGYTGFAANPPAIPLPWIRKQYEKIERPFQLSGKKGQLRVVGYPAAIPGTEDLAAAECERTGVWLDANDPCAVEWNIAECYYYDTDNDTGDFDRQTILEEPMDDLAKVTERLLAEIARRTDPDFSGEESITGTVEPQTPGPVKSVEPVKPVISPAKTNTKKTPTVVPPPPDWSKPSRTGIPHRPEPITGSKIIDIENERLERLLSETQENLAQAQRLRDEWQATAQAMCEQQRAGAWQESPDDLAAAWAAFDMDKAIDFYKALEEN
jgi:hypothetical protein